MGALLGGGLYLVGATLWLATLLMTGFSVLAVSLGLLAALFILNGNDHSVA
jgi:hypothetical protein